MKTVAAHLNNIKLDIAIDDYVLISGNDYQFNKEVKEFIGKGYIPYGELKITLEPVYEFSGVISDHKKIFTREFILLDRS